MVAPDIDKRNAMLVSRVACLGKIRHSAKGYSGPLSRHMLAYHSIVSNVHASLRDLLEMIVAAMFLEGLVDRDRNDWADISVGYVYGPKVRIAKCFANASTACHSIRSNRVLSVS